MTRRYGLTSTILCAAASVLALTATDVALADSLTIGEVTVKAPEEGNSWWAPLTFLGSLGDEIDHVQVQITDTYDQNFVDPDGIDRFVDDGSTWSQEYNDGTLLIAEGNADWSFGFALHFDGDHLTDSIEYDVEFYEGENLFISLTLEWNADDAVWTGTLNTSSQMGGFQAIPTPEPASLFMFGLAALGLVWTHRRRRVAHA